jgi:myosin heavy subunit
MEAQTAKSAADTEITRLKQASTHTEWTISELKSAMQVEEMKRTEAVAQHSTAAAKLLEAEKSLAITRRELEDAKRSTQRDLDAAQRKLEKLAATASKTESERDAATQRAGQAEAALRAFKGESSLALAGGFFRTCT